MTRQEMQALQAMPYDLKVKRAELRAKEFYQKVDACHVSVGGLDSITLLFFLLHYVLANVPFDEIGESIVEGYNACISPSVFK